MLSLSALHDLLSQVLSLPDLHTAILITCSGQLVSVACDPLRPKDEIRVVVGLSGEVWQETREQGYGMVDSEVLAWLYHVLLQKSDIRITMAGGKDHGVTRGRTTKGASPASARRLSAPHVACIECNRCCRVGRVAVKSKMPIHMPFLRSQWI